MKSKLKIFFIAFCVVLISCASHSTKEIAAEDSTSVPVPPARESFETGKVIPNAICKSNPAFSFALYLPSNYDTTKKFPAIIFFDPHAGGEFVVKKYQHLAEEFSFILIGSNDSKNGLSMDQTNQIASALISDATSRFSTFKDVSLAGFSGGAKVALSSAMQNQKVTSVIYCGAAIPLSSSVKFSLLGFAGVNDMNYTDVTAFDQSIENPSVKHYLIEWNGKHEWPDSATFRNSFYWIDFNSNRVHDSGAGNTVNKFLNENHEPPSSAAVWTRAMFDLKMISFLKGVTDVFLWEKEYQELAASDGYKSELKTRLAVLQKEENQKQLYLQDFQTQDLSWWKKETGRLSASKNPSDQRLLGYISLAGYSISSNAIQQNNFPLAEKMLVIYKLADPKNSDQPFLEACLYAKQGNNDGAMESLQHAVDLGLNDPSKITGEPALQPLLGDARLQELLSKMK